MIKLILFFSFFAVFLFESSALPRFALRMGGQCIDCHVNPTGGNLRNSGGWLASKNQLALISPRKEFEMTNQLGENILFGFDFRGQYLAVLRENLKRTDFQRMTGSVYTDVSISEQIDIFARYDFIWGIWEAYGTARILPNESYIKAGSFTPNFGIRLDDHTAYTRGGDLGVVTTAGSGKQGLIYEPTYVETGGEIGIYVSDFAFFTASVGNPRSPQLFVTDPSYTASLQIMPFISPEIHLMFGGSAAVFKDPRQNTNFQIIYPEVKMFGGFLGLNYKNFSLLGEFDIAQDYVSMDTSSTALMIEASYQIIKGLEAVVRYDRFDPMADVEKDDVSRLILGFEVFPYSFIEIRPQFRLQMEDPKVENNSVVVQFHLFY